MTQIVRTHPINPGAQLLKEEAFTKAILSARAPTKEKKKKTALKLSLRLLSARKLKA